MAEDLELRDARPLPVMSEDEIRQTFRTADALFKSGFFPDVKRVTEAFAKVVAGRELGLGAFEAMSSLHVIEGKIEASADLHASRVKAHPNYDYVVQTLTDTECSIMFWQDGDEIGTSTFTIEDAQLAGLVKEKSPWKKYPRNMLFARAMTNGVAWHCPDVMGGLRVYTPGELSESRQDVTAGEGDYVEPEDLRKAIEEWAPSRHWAAVIATVIEHARELGHAGLSDYGMLKVKLGGQDAAFLMRWSEQADAELVEAADARPEKVEEAQVVDDKSALELEQEALRLADEADAAEVNEEPEKAEKLRAEAAGLHGRVAEMTNPQQIAMED